MDKMVQNLSQYMSQYKRIGKRNNWKDNNIMDEYKKRLGAFLSEYANITDESHSMEDEKVIRQSIKILIEKRVFTMEEMRKTALKDHNILISENYIEECIYGWLYETDYMDKGENQNVF